MRGDSSDATSTSRWVSGPAKRIVWPEAEEELGKQEMIEGAPKEVMEGEEGGGMSRFRRQELPSLVGRGVSLPDRSVDDTISNSSPVVLSDLGGGSAEDLNSRYLGSRIDLTRAQIPALGLGGRSPEKTQSQGCSGPEPVQSLGDRNHSKIPKERRRLFGKFYRKANRSSKVKQKSAGGIDADERDFLSITRSALTKNLSRMRSGKKNRKEEFSAALASCQMVCLNPKRFYIVLLTSCIIICPNFF